MSTTKKRTYHSESRKARAQETRSRILAAAKNLFAAKGFDKVTIEEIALAAEVSVPTVYSLFQSKRGVLRALMDEALSPQQFDSLIQQVKEENSPQKRLEIAARIPRQLYDAEKIQINLLRGASVIDPELKELEAEREERRYQRQNETIKTLEQEGVLAEGLNLSKAKDIYWALTGRDFYRLLVLERGWSSDEYEKWLAQLLVQILIK